VFSSLKRHIGSQNGHVGGPMAEDKVVTMDSSGSDATRASFDTRLPRSLSNATTSKQ
jgi:hypothetical protein